MFAWTNPLISETFLNASRELMLKGTVHLKMIIHSFTLPECASHNNTKEDVLKNDKQPVAKTDTM